MGIIGVLSAEIALGGDELDAMGIATKYGCIACHQRDNRIVGPAWTEIGRKYANQAELVDVLVDRVRRGSNGVWGGLPMPPNPTVKDADIKMFVQFILMLK